MAKGNKLVAGLVMGAAVGAAAGLLLAPKPGREAQQVGCHGWAIFGRRRAIRCAPSAGRGRRKGTPRP
jgi:gas vesicle protein